jgi:hypothetical protein
MISSENVLSRLGAWFDRLTILSVVEGKPGEL